MRGRRRSGGGEHRPLQIYGGLADGCALGAVIKPSIWLWGRLITQPDPQSETTVGPGKRITRGRTSKTAKEPETQS